MTDLQRAKEEYYGIKLTDYTDTIFDNDHFPYVFHAVEYILELEKINAEMLEALIDEAKYADRCNYEIADKTYDVIEKATGKPIQEVLNASDRGE